MELTDSYWCLRAHARSYGLPPLRGFPPFPLAYCLHPKPLTSRLWPRACSLLPAPCSLPSIEFGFNGVKHLPGDVNVTGPLDFTNTRGAGDVQFGHIFADDVDPGE